MTERIVGRPWTAQEDRLLASAVAVHGESDNWKAVAHCVPERSNKACRKASRWLHSLSPNVKKSAWTPEEDHLLLELYEVHSTKWSVIARHIPGRTDDACSKRYREALDPSLRRDEWSKEEDDRLFDAYSRLAGRWGQVGQELQRSGLACRNRWRLLERKRNNLTEPQGVAVSKFGPYQTGEIHAVPHPITSVPPADNTSAVFDYGVVLDPSLVNATRTTDYTVGHRPVYEDHVAQYNEIQRSVAPTPVPSHIPVPPQRASEYYSPAPHHNECHHQLIRDGETSPSQLSRDSRYPTTSQGPSAALVPTALGLPHEATDSYYVAHRQQLEHVQHVVMSSPDSSSVCSVSHEYFPSSSSSDHCSPVSPVDGALHQTPCNQYYPSPEHVVPAHQDISSISRPTTTAPEARGDYYQPQFKGQLQPQFHPLSNEPKLNGHCAPMSVADTGPPTVSPNFHSAPSAQCSASISPSAYVHLRTASPKTIGSVTQLTNAMSFLSPSIKPYACGHESCWPVAAASSLACYTTSRGLSDHNKSSHPEDSGGERPYRCGLDGCGKSWKARYFGSESINGLQYHLQISKAHFQHAIVSTFVTSYIDGLAVPCVDASPGESDGKTKKQYSCPHQGCPNRYKQLSGLRYHLTHGHPTDLPVQLDLVPPALSRKLAEKMRKDGTGSQPPETHTHNSLPVPAPSQSCSPGHVSA
ncbi:uncharacterized protein F5147DRAFT_566041 [Suillus discolor]|uniref:Transcriptional activator Myb n=1 Tax=Suillus discolor TaxID=1912936 RepID=A0A9P7FJD6_9AGAM|nr:uncharacterized protein F5147DRAFT_566041 [Suillus discolor]KAG2117932.1 hypothetical protein F5147DRAFT_566041 [Suillus discolor]